MDVHRADLDTELESVDPSLQNAQDASALEDEEDPVRAPKVFSCHQRDTA